MKPNFKSILKTLKGAVLFPKYQFSGLVLIFALAIFVTFQNYKDDTAQSRLLSAPLAGDVYVLRNNEDSSKYKYYLLKVRSIEEDSINISHNSFKYSVIPAKLDSVDGFYDYSIKVAKQFHVEKHENGELKKVIRDSSGGFSRTLEYDMVENTKNESALINYE